MSDTRAEAAAYHRRLYAEMAPSQRLKTALELSETTREITLAGLRRRNPHLSEEELRSRLLDLCYGDVVST